MTPAEETKAQQRFLVINLIRISGAVMLVIGLAVIARGLFDLPVAAGYALFVIGMADFLIVPLMLSKAWKSPNSQ
ncbi:MAG: hypothetical protein WBO17_11060 [Sphingorhabdus sp.]